MHLRYSESVADITATELFRTKKCGAIKKKNKKRLDAVMSAAAASAGIVGLEDLPDSPSGPPVAVKQAAAVIEGVHTEIIVSK